MSDITERIQNIRCLIRVRDNAIERYNENPIKFCKHLLETLLAEHRYYGTTKKAKDTLKEQITQVKGWIRDMELGIVNKI